MWTEKQPQDLAAWVSETLTKAVSAHWWGLSGVVSILKRDQERRN